MKFSNPCLAALPLAALIQLVCRTKAASTKGLTIADGMVVELCKGSNITADTSNEIEYWLPALMVGEGDYSSNGGASLTITGGSYISINANGMEVTRGSVATVLGGLIQRGLIGDGMFVDQQAVATVCDGIIQGGTNSNLNYGWSGVYVIRGAIVRIAGGMMIGGNNPAISGYGLWNNGDLTITGGTFKGGFGFNSSDQAPSLLFQCGNTSIYGGTYKGNWTNKPDEYCVKSTKVYGKDLVLKDNHLVGTLCDGNPIDVYISGEPITVNIVNNCASFPEFEECGGKGGKPGKKTKSFLFRP